MNSEFDLMTRTHIKRKNFQIEINGKKTDLYKIENNNGLEVLITNYGATVVSISTPDKDGNFSDIDLGFDTISDYLKDENPYIGCIVGRYANRINNGRFTLDKRQYQLSINQPEIDIHLHGGKKGFDKCVWDAKQNSKSELGLTLFSPHGDQGFPGNLKVKVVYSLSNNNELNIDYTAITDKTTVINLTQHSYFNLEKEGSDSILNHEIRILADKYTVVDERSIPSGRVDSVVGTPMDLRMPTLIKDKIDSHFDQLIFGNGFDHNWVLNKDNNDDFTLAATLYSKKTGRFLEVYTTEPGLQFYCGNFLNGSLTGKSGIKYNRRSGLCLEAQHFPDSPNHSDFPSTVLEPGKVYKQKTCYKFSVK